MFSTTRAEPHASGSERSAVLVGAAQLAATHFGLDLGKYPKSVIETLLSGLPKTRIAEDESAVARILSVCSIGETMFMRHPDQLRAIVELCGNGSIGDIHRPLRVWSAGCATGEEAYSLAALLRGRPSGVKVLGTDLSRAAIERGEHAQYRMWSLRGTDPAALSGWIEICGLELRVSADVRAHVTFEEHNLVRDAYPEGLDLIVCRNVLLYFCNDAAERVLQKFEQALRPGGALFLGYVDPVPGVGTSLVEMYHQGVRYYRKPLPMEAATSRAPSVRISTSADTSSRTQQFLVPKHDSRKETTVPTSEMTEETRRERIELARSLCGQGARREALSLLSELVEEDPLRVEPHVLIAMVADEEGDAQAALVAARRAYFLAPNAPITAFLLASALERVGERATAETRYREALQDLLRIEDPAEPLPFGEGITALQLRRTIDARTKRG